MGGAQYLRSDHACLPIAAAIALPSMLGARARVCASRANALGRRARAHLQRHERRDDPDALRRPAPARARAAGRAGRARARASRAVSGGPGAAAGRERRATSPRSRSTRPTAPSRRALSAVMGVGGLPLTMSYLSLATAEESFPHHLVQGTAMVAVVPSILASAGSARRGGQRAGRGRRVRVGRRHHGRESRRAARALPLRRSAEGTLHAEPPRSWRPLRDWCGAPGEPSRAALREKQKSGLGVSKQRTKKHRSVRARAEPAGPLGCTSPTRVRAL